MPAIRRNLSWIIVSNGCLWSKWLTTKRIPHWPTTQPISSRSKNKLVSFVWTRRCSSFLLVSFLGCRKLLHRSHTSATHTAQAAIYCLRTSRPAVSAKYERDLVSAEIPNVTLNARRHAWLLLASLHSLMPTQCNVIDRSGAGVVRFMRPITSGHGNWIRGTSRAENQSRR